MVLIARPTSAVLSAFRHGTHVRFSSTKSQTVNLAYDRIVPANGNATKQPLVILHGLL